MTLVIRKQLEKIPETSIFHINAFPQWFKFVVDFRDINAPATSNVVTLCTLPIKAWIHALHWKVTIPFEVSWGSGTSILNFYLGDQDNKNRWVDGEPLIGTGRGGYVGLSVEDGLGIIPWEPDFDNTHDLKADFFMDPAAGGEDLDRVVGGEITFWFLLSSMNGGVA